MSRIDRPGRDEYGEYYHRYVSKVPDGDIVDLLRSQRAELAERFGSLAETVGDRRYAPGKWSVKQLVGHLIDVERAFAWRAHAFSRNEASELPGFEQDDYVEHAGYDARTLASLVEELDAERGASLALFRGLEPAQWERSGIASGYEMSVRAGAYIIHGHAVHHIAVLEERYLRG